MDYMLTALLFFLIGVGVYAIERWVAIKILKKDLKKYKGLVIGGKPRNKYIIATLVMIAKFWISIEVFNVKTDQKIILFTVLEWVSVMLGLLTGSWALPRVRKLFGRGQKYVEHIESGQVVNPLQDLKEAVTSQFKKSGGVATEKKTEDTDIGTTQTDKEVAQETEQETPAIVAEEKKEEEKDNRTPQKKMNAAVDEFLKRK